MKQSDIRQGRRIARLVDQLTRNELEAVMINSDNPDGEGKNDCLVMANRYEPGHVLADPNGFICRQYTDRTVVGCLLQALADRGLVEEMPPDDGSEYEKNLLELKDSGRKLVELVGSLEDSIEHHYKNMDTVIESFRFLQLHAEALALRLAEDYNAF